MNNTEWKQNDIGYYREIEINSLKAIEMEAFYHDDDDEDDKGTYKGIVLINLTPHPINHYFFGNVDEDFLLKIPCSGVIARLTEEREVASHLPDNMDVFALSIVKYGYSNELKELPESKENVYYIVSSLVKTKYIYRQDLLVPNELVRNEKGQIIGCSSFTVGIKGFFEA